MCIKEPNHKSGKTTGRPYVIRVGEIYTVVEFLTFDVPGYRLAEDLQHTYSTDYFAPLSEINELEFERNYELEKYDHPNNPRIPRE